MDKADALRVAAQMLADFGDRAITVANSRLRELVRLGNTEAASSWLKIVAAIEELSRAKPDGHEALH